MNDVIHDPDTDWCACEPNSDRRCDYRLLADTVIEELNPPDADEAEVAICIAAVERIARFAESLPCTCSHLASAEEDPCSRCEALGRTRDRRVER